MANQEMKCSPVQQVINAELDYVDKFEHFLTQHKYDEFGADYKTISIIGPQNSGKSTLLNRVFETKFLEMDASEGIQQTTQGVWFSCAEKDRIFVLDIQGSDSIERGDDRKTFEQTTALLALSFSDVLFVNMWESDIGRAQGSSYEILKTIFEINLKLFKQDSAKNIIFMVRDFDMQRYGEKGFQNIKKRVQGRLEEMWNSIGKPQEFQNRPFQDFFGFSFQTLPSIHKEEEFHVEIQKLRDRLVNKENPKYLLNIKGTGDNVPVDGLPLFIEKSWEKIRSDKDINLPSQKQMISNLRCNQFKQQAIALQKELIQDLKQKSRKKFNPNFKDSAQTILKNAISHYQRSAKHYFKKIYQQVHEALESQLIGILYNISQDQLMILDKEAYNEWKKQITQFIQKDKVSEHFSIHVNQIIQKIISNFISKTNRLKVEGSNWNLEDVIENLNEKLNSFALSVQQQELQKLKDILLNRMQNEIKKVVHSLIIALDENFWQNLKNKYYQTLDSVIENVQQILSEGFKLKDDQSFERVSQIRRDGPLILKKRVLKECSELNPIMRERFNTMFKKDEKGKVRDWLSLEEEQIHDLFTQLRERLLNSLYQLNCFCIQSQFGESQPRSNKLSRGFTANYERTILDEKVIQRIQARFDEDIEMIYDQAINKHNGRGGGKVPFYFWIIALFFGYEKLIGYMYSPFLFYPLILIGGIFAMLHSMGLSGVFLSAIKLTLNRVFRKFKIPIHI